MKMVGAALLGSAFTMLLVMLTFKDRLFVKSPIQGNALSLRELNIVDESGAVRMRLSTQSELSRQGAPVFELLTRKMQRGGVILLLDESGRGSLYFDSTDTDAKVSVGHFITGDSLPLSESDHSWGIRVLNLNPVTEAPRSLYFAASEGGNAGISGVSVKQGQPQDSQPVRIPKQ
jgi:hypothetical protein